MQYFSIPQKITALIFDIDSTLYTNPFYAKEQIDCQIRHYADLQGISHKNARELIQKKRKEWADFHNGEKISLGNLFLHLGISIEESVEWRKTLFNPQDFLSYDEKLVKKIEKLHSDFKIACVTNNPVSQGVKTLEVLGVLHFIREVVGLDTCMESKPSEKMFLRALNSLKCEAKNAVSIGDRFDVDLKLPLKMGMGGVLVLGVEDVYKIDFENCKKKRAKSPQRR